MTTTKEFHLGTVSQATLNPKDLLPAFANCLQSMISKGDWIVFLAVNEIPHIFDNGNIEIYWNRINYQNHDHISWYIGQIEDKLNEICPPFIYFGSHIGDGADIGFWVDYDSIQELYENVEIKSQVDDNLILIISENNQCAFLGSFDDGNFVPQYCLAIDDKLDITNGYGTILWQI